MLPFVFSAFDQNHTRIGHHYRPDPRRIKACYPDVRHPEFVAFALRVTDAIRISGPADLPDNES